MAFNVLEVSTVFQYIITVFAVKIFNSLLPLVAGHDTRIIMHASAEILYPHLLLTGVH
jgi:hypothetical protein